MKLRNKVPKFRREKKKKEEKIVFKLKTTSASFVVFNRWLSQINFFFQLINGEGMAVI